MAAGQIKAPIIIPLKTPQYSKTKNLTTDTKFDLISESSDIDIYFTVNGAKPDPFKLTNDKSTFKYNVPFTLPAGKRTVKAVAVSKDGSRESNVVTKVFEIDLIEKMGDVNNKLQSDTFGFLEELKDQKKDSYRKNDQNNNSHNQNIRTITPHYLESNNKREMKISDIMSGINSENKSSKKNQSNDFDMDLVNKQKSKLLTDMSSQSMRIQRETDFLKCVYCLAPRPSDAQAKFCNYCGQVVPPLPQSRLPPPENGQLGMCVHCRSTVPMNVSNCLVCESPLNIQNQPQATLRLREKILCTICGTANPPNMDSCLTCESKLPESGKSIKMMHPNEPPEPPFLAINSMKDIALICCVNCGRQNNMDARFCDWCGGKPMNQNSSYAQAAHIVCLKCMANNENNANFCCQCGNTIEPPSRDMKYTNEANQWNHITLPLHVKSTNGIYKPDNLLQNGSVMFRKYPHSDVSTQTVGLFFPSTAQLSKNENEKQKAVVTNNAWEKPVSLSVVSPGKGFWRKQTDHVIAHLKAHASNTAEFQAMIGEPRMGKLISANVHEEDFELSLTLTFALKGYADPYPNGTAADYDKRYLSTMLKRSGSFDSFRSDSTVISNGTNKTRKTPTTSARCRSAKKRNLTKKSAKSSDTDMTEIDRKLLKEIGKSGEGRDDEIETLIEEGANPRCKSRKGIPFIMVAVRNKHVDAIRALKKSGADFNDTDAETGNTCLHEAVTLGALYEDVISELLNLSANTKIKNHKGETAYDLAVKMKNESAIKLLSTNIGRNQMGKLTQPKHTGDEDNDNI